MLILSALAIICVALCSYKAGYSAGTRDAARIKPLEYRKAASDARVLSLVSSSSPERVDAAPGRKGGQ